MSSPLKRILIKRSTSCSGSRPYQRPSYLPPHNHIALHSHSDYHNDSFSISDHRNVHTESSFHANDGPNWANDNNLTLHKDIERLCESNYQLKEDNKVFAEKMNHVNILEDQLNKLDALNKQLLKEITKKDELLLWKEKELNQSTHDVLRKSQFQPGYGEIFAQNKALIDEVSMLRAQLVSSKQDRGSSDLIQGSPHKTQLKLDQANVQLELLKEDLVRKNFQIEEMTDALNKLRAERNQYRSEEDKLRQKELLEKDYKLELINNKEQLETVRSKLEEAVIRAEGVERREEHLRNNILELESETKSLKQTILRIQHESEEELRNKERILEISIKAKTNDAIKQMLKEKVQYEEMIGYLKDKSEALEKESASLKVNLEVERRELNEERRNAKESERNFRSRGSARDDFNSYDYSILKEALRNEEIRNKKLEEDLEYNKLKVIELEKELLETREKLRENTLQRENNSHVENLLREENTRLRSEISLLEKKLLEYKEQIQNDEQKVKSVTTDCEKLAALYTEIEEQLETERCEKEQLAEEYLNKMEQLEAELSEFKSRDIGLIETTARFNREKSTYEREIQQFRVSNERTKDELEKIYELLAQGKQETDVYKKQNEQLKKEVERLKQFLIGTGKVNSQELDSLQTNFDTSEKKAVIRLNRLLEENNLKKGFKADESESQNNVNK